MIVGIPVMQLMLFGYAINLDLRDLDDRRADQANTAASRALVMDMVATGVIQPAASPRTRRRRSMTLLRAGEISAGRRDSAGLRARRFDGREAGAGARRRQRHGRAERRRAAAQLPLDYRHSTQRDASDASEHAGGRSSVVSFYNPERRSAVNIVPGLVGVILTMTMVLFTGVAHRARARARQPGAADRDAVSAAAS